MSFLLFRLIIREIEWEQDIQLASLWEVAAKYPNDIVLTPLAHRHGEPARLLTPTRLDVEVATVSWRAG